MLHFDDIPRQRDGQVARREQPHRAARTISHATFPAAIWRHILDKLRWARGKQPRTEDAHVAEVGRVRETDIQGLNAAHGKTRERLNTLESYATGIEIILVGVMQIAKWDAELEPESISARLVLDQHVVIPFHDDGTMFSPREGDLRA